MSVQCPSTSAKGYLPIFSRSSGNWASGGYPNSGYFIEVANDSTNVGLRKVSSGTTTQLRNAAVGQVTMTKQWLRFRVEGPDIKAKVWTDGTQEPSNWEVEATDASFSEPGALQLRWARAAATTDAREVYIDDLRVSDLDTNSALLQRRPILRLRRRRPHRRICSGRTTSRTRALTQSNAPSMVAWIGRS